MVQPRKEVEALPEFVPAKSIDFVKREYGVENVIKLAGNENTLGFSQYVRNAMNELTSYYPDGAAYNLRQELAKIHNISPDNIVLGNGSFELLSLIGQVFLSDKDETIMAVPSFGWYKNVTAVMGAEMVSVPLTDYKVDLDKILDAVTEKTKIIWLTNPNNPTGTIFTGKQLEQFLSKVSPKIAVVLDEAYIDYVVEDDFPDSVRCLKKYDNVIILRTFSKLDGLAGFRIGYAIADKSVISYINKVRLPMNVNQPAQLAALAALKDTDFRKSVIENAHTELEKYYKKFEEHGWFYVKSNTNFVLVKLPADSEFVVEEFLKRGILIRAGAEFGYPDMCRISIGTKEENDKVIAVLEEILN